MDPSDGESMNVIIPGKTGLHTLDNWHFDDLETNMILFYKPNSYAAPWNLFVFGFDNDLGRVIVFPLRTRRHRKVAAIDFVPHPCVFRQASLSLNHKMFFSFPTSVLTVGYKLRNLNADVNYWAEPEDQLNQSDFFK